MGWEVCWVYPDGSTSCGITYDYLWWLHWPF